MKVLWLCNIPLPKISEVLSNKKALGGGWLVGASNSLINNNVELVVCYNEIFGTNEVDGEIDGIRYYSFNNKDNKTRFKNILNDENPDVIHIWGTEYKHGYDMALLCKELGLIDKVIVDLQGLTSVIYQHYTLGLPNSVVKSWTLRDFIKKDNIYYGKEKFKKRGIYEQQALKIVKNVMGRTEWDYACSLRLNPTVNYYFCNRTLRDSFYNNERADSDIEKHSIFVSQCSYPVKGFHFVLDAMKDIIKKYPDAKLYTTGKSPFGLNFKEKLMQTSYNKYIGKLIKKYNLQTSVVFLGGLDEKSMCDRYKKSQVFVSASTIENSPNSVAEAMILGVPVVTSDVGGVKDYVEHNKSGYIYQTDAPYMLAHYVCKIFEDYESTRDMINNAKIKANELFNKENNCNRLIEIYNQIKK